MLTDFVPIAILFLIAAELAVLVVIIGHTFGPRRPTERKSNPYESGMRPIGPGTRRMPVRFYLVAVLFIIFDVEVIFIIPWALRVRELGAYGLAVMGVFIILLLVGFIYEWKKGGMEWE